MEEVNEILVQVSDIQKLTLPLFHFLLGSQRRRSALSLPILPLRNPSPFGGYCCWSRFWGHQIFFSLGWPPPWSLLLGALHFRFCKFENGISGFLHPTIFMHLTCTICVDIGFCSYWGFRSFCQLEFCLTNFFTFSSSAYAFATAHGHEEVEAQHEANNLTTGSNSTSEPSGTYSGYCGQNNLQLQQKLNGACADGSRDPQQNSNQYNPSYNGVFKRSTSNEFLNHPV